MKNNTQQEVPIWTRMVIVISHQTLSRTNCPSDGVVSQGIAYMDSVQMNVLPAAFLSTQSLREGLGREAKHNLLYHGTVAIPRGDCHCTQLEHANNHSLSVRWISMFGFRICSGRQCTCFQPLWITPTENLESNTLNGSIPTDNQTNHWIGWEVGGVNR